jgi:hypothetical protein
MNRARPLRGLGRRLSTSARLSIRAKGGATERKRRLFLFRPAVRQTAQPRSPFVNATHQSTSIEPYRESNQEAKFCPSREGRVYDPSCIAHLLRCPGFSGPTQAVEVFWKDLPLGCDTSSERAPSIRRCLGVGPIGTALNPALVWVCMSTDASASGTA